MRILAVSDPRLPDTRTPEVERKFALQQMRGFIRLAEIRADGGECPVIEIVERSGELELHICGARLFSKVKNLNV